MMLHIVVLAAILAQTPAPAPMEEGVRLARAGRHAEALRLFEDRAARNPGDLEARVWIGRLLLWTGRPREAESVFTTILSEFPSTVDAMLGLGTARLAQSDPAGALDVLARAEAAAPDSAEVLATVARAHYRAGRSTVALAYARKAALSGAGEHRLLAEEIARAHGHRVEVVGFVETFNRTVPEAHQGDASANFRMTDAVRVFGRVQLQRKFGLNDARGGGGVEWRARRDLTVTAHALGGPGNVVLPEFDSQVDVAHTRGRFEWSGGARYMRFNTAIVTLLSPGLSLEVNDRLTVGGRYFLATADFASADDPVVSHSWLLRASVRTHRRLWITAGYARGVENFETLTVDRLGEFRAHTTSMGARVELPSLTAVAAGFEHQRRSDGAVMNRATAILVQRF